MTREDLRRIIQEEVENHMVEEGIISWMVDKVANGLKTYVNKKAGYQYDALLNSKDFRSLASRYGYGSEDAWVKKARELINRDPKKFANILAYDYKKDSYKSKGYKI